MDLFSFVTCAGGGFVESEEDLAAAHKAGYIARALEEMIFIGSFFQRSTTPRVPAFCSPHRDRSHRRIAVHTGS
jgi:hypothetical protein